MGMNTPNQASSPPNDPKTLIEELLRTALWIFDITTSFLDDLPDDAFPGEDPAAVMVEMLVGSCRPAIEAAGEAGCRAAIDLAGAIRENIRDDLRAAADLSHQRTSEMLL
jgi:hypothetical protein